MTLFTFVKRVTLFFLSVMLWYTFQNLICYIPHHNLLNIFQTRFSNTIPGILLFLSILRSLVKFTLPALLSFPHLRFRHNHSPFATRTASFQNFTLNSSQVSFSSTSLVCLKQKPGLSSLSTFL